MNLDEKFNDRFELCSTISLSTKRGSSELIFCGRRMEFHFFDDRTFASNSGFYLERADRVVFQIRIFFPSILEKSSYESKNWFDRGWGNKISREHFYMVKRTTNISKGAVIPGQRNKILSRVFSVRKNIPNGRKVSTTRTTQRDIAILSLSRQPPNFVTRYP